MTKREVTLISEATVARLKDGSVLNVSAPYIVTPSAADLAAKKRITIEVTERESDPAESNPAPDGEASLASRVESTLLTSCATPEQIVALCDEAAALECYGVCVAPRYVALAVKHTTGHETSVITVCGFPLGANLTEIKAAEARLAEAQGAAEIDMVMPVGALLAGDLASVRDEIVAVRQALKKRETVLKVIVEASLLSEEQIVQACVLACEAGADYVKTGTGFAGPVTEDAVALMKQAVGDRCKIKAAGGIKTRAQAEAMIAAGADRIGTSSAGGILG